MQIVQLQTGRRPVVVGTNLLGALNVEVGRGPGGRGCVPGGSAIPCLIVRSGASCVDGGVEMDAAPPHAATAVAEARALTAAPDKDGWHVHVSCERCFVPGRVTRVQERSGCISVAITTSWAMDPPQIEQRQALSAQGARSLRRDAQRVVTAVLSIGAWIEQVRSQQQLVQAGLAMCEQNGPRAKGRDASKQMGQESSSTATSVAASVFGGAARRFAPGQPPVARSEEAAASTDSAASLSPTCCRCCSPRSAVRAPFTGGAVLVSWFAALLPWLPSLCRLWCWFSWLLATKMPRPPPPTGSLSSSVGNPGEGRPSRSLDMVVVRMVPKSQDDGPTSYSLLVTCHCCGAFFFSSNPSWWWWHGDFLQIRSIGYRTLSSTEIFEYSTVAVIFLGMVDFLSRRRSELASLRACELSFEPRRRQRQPSPASKPCSNASIGNMPHVTATPAPHTQTRVKPLLRYSLPSFKKEWLPL